MIPVASSCSLPVRTWHCPVPQLLLSLPCHTRAEMGGQDNEPGDGVVHKTSPALTLNVLLRDACTIWQR